MLQSILDNDLYKFTMQQAVLECFPTTKVTYRFTNRDTSMKFNEEAYKAIEEAIGALADLALTNQEYRFLQERCPFFKPMYLEYLKNFRFDPGCVMLSMKDGNLSLEIEGTWAETILFEVPLMAIISEAYFKHVDTDWTIDGQEELALHKGRMLTAGECTFVDFGTRRRRSFLSQWTLAKTMKSMQGFVGTSNVYIAFKLDLKPIGTMAHEWVMGVSALRGLRHANHNALHLWVKVYDADLGIALTDTYGTEAFFEDFDLKLSKTFDGVRHDSGDPYTFTDKVIAHYRSQGIDPSTKTIVFSDGLDCALAMHLRDYCNSLGIRRSFGIGTHFTNDFRNSDGEKSKPLNMVIKLRTCDGIEVVKLSDDVGKATGDRDAVRVAKWTFLGTPLDV